MAEFNLVEQPWVPVRMRDGTAENGELGLLATLLRAHEVAEVYDPSPLVTASLHRLLLAVLHRALDGPPDEEAWCALWSRGRFEEAPLKTYLKKWGHRFDLFHPERPFYQTVEVRSTKPKPISRLAQVAENNALLFDHSVDSNPEPRAPAHAARLLIAAQAFAVGGGVSEPFNFFDSTLTKGISLLAVGETLFETLLLNMMPITPERPIPRVDADDPPCWERDKLPDPEYGGNPIQGFLDLLTWQGRRIWLEPDEDGRVRWVRILQGWKLPQDRDPFKFYRMDPKEGIQPVKFRPEKALWRDSHTLLPSYGVQEMPYGVLIWHGRVAQLARRNRIQMSHFVRLMAFGQTTGGKGADIILWRQERLPLPLDYLDPEREMLRARLKQALDIAEKAKDALQKGAWHLGRFYLFPMKEKEGSLGKNQQGDVKNLIKSIAPERVFWPRLEVPFRSLFLSLPAQAPEEGAIDLMPSAFSPWADEVRRACMEAFEFAVNKLGADAKALKAAARARPEFRMALAAAVKPFRKEEEAHG